MSSSKSNKEMHRSRLENLFNSLKCQNNQYEQSNLWNLQKFITCRLKV